MITVFLGDNGPARESALKEFVGNFVGIHGSTAVDKFSGESIELAALKDSVATIPFLSPKRMVVVRDLSANKNLSDKFEDIAGSVADSTELVIVENHLDSRSKYLAELKKQAEVKEFAHLEGEDLVKWVIEQAEQQDGFINRNCAVILIERVGTNHQLLANEIAKLVLFDSKISEESILTLTSFSPQSSVFAMLDSAFNNQPAKAMKLYKEQRVQGMEPQAILGMITWQLHVLAVVKAAGEMPAQQIANEAKINPFVVRKNLNIARKITKRKLIKMLDDAIAADEMLKRTSANADDVLQTLIISFK